MFNTADIWEPSAAPLTPEGSQTRWASKLRHKLRTQHGSLSSLPRMHEKLVCHQRTLELKYFLILRVFTVQSMQQALADYRTALDNDFDLR